MLIVTVICKKKSTISSKNIERSFCVLRFKLDATLLQWFLNKTVNYLN